MNNVLAVIPAWEKDIRGSCRVNFKSSPADKIMYCGYKWWAKDNGISGPLGSIALSAASSSDPFIFKTKQYDSPDPAVYWADDDYSQGWAKAAALFMSMERRVWDMPNSFEDFCLDEFEKVSSTGEGLVSHLKYSDKGASLSVQEQVQASIDVGGPTVLYCGLRWWSLSQTSTAGSLSDSATLKSGAKFFFHLKAYQPSGSGAWGTTANAKDWSKMAALMMAVERLVAQMPREHEHYCDSDFGSVSKQGRKIVRALSFSTRTKGTGSPEENMFNDFFKQKNERGPQNNPVCRFYTTQSLAREEGKQCREYRIKMEKTVSASGWKAGVQSSQKQSQS
uniref:Uncharacterized protein n=1 Tax=Chromera velia CCMP2878 TaxID=1169474 RepID=A0A0G4HRN1_9ALVE|eukprot:Cvel_30670.t1-p1 / transcript=Cvel_30670.t1 / gene=Cvel_30670 / organism=Chromera_velia_CCMP2878 / gene_product=hypothetical protein / transcript_product=hypothetical protein / location=Cvel_scaffold4415:6986-9771(-) / protein_length=335 / sequence_SO=supercontig / SO=protein_coding / is_pseudo=false